MWLAVGAGLGAVIGLAYLALSERLKECCSTALGLLGWAFLLAMFALIWLSDTGRIWIGESNLGIRIFETIAISFLVILFGERLYRDIRGK